ncbi:MAG TPA: POTRA domain-containing protein, partial [Terriglobales bacterium]|nr:POTRA domain-containing protein [Terriglobales bacterium]
MSCRCLVWGAVGAAVLLAIPLCAQQEHPRTRRNNKQDETTAFNRTASAFSLDKDARASFGAPPAAVERTSIALAGSSRPDPHGIEAPWPRLGGAETARHEEPGDRQDVILRIEFTGMRRIAPAALRARITSREGQPLDAARIADDVRALDRLGWFDSVSAEVHPIPVFLADTQTGANSQPEWHGPNDPAELAIESARLGTAAEPVEDINRPLAMIASPERARIGLLLLFVLEERPFLARVEFHGSRALSGERIASVLEQKRIALKLAAPANRTELWRAARAIEAALADLGHPQAQVRLRLEETPTAAAVAKYEIQDGPRISVARVVFAGNHAFSERTLRRQMKRVAPGSGIAGIPISLGRGERIYTPQRLAEDIERLASFYRNHGFPEARVGNPTAEVTADRIR